jgi:hypothetical protein
MPITNELILRPRRDFFLVLLDSDRVVSQEEIEKKFGKRPEEVQVVVSVGSRVGATKDEKSGFNMDDYLLMNSRELPPGSRGPMQQAL